MIRRGPLAFLRRTRASASSEFALALPMMLPLIFGSMEAGNFFWSQQKLTQAVRDGTRYAARLDYTDVCPSLATGVEANIKNLTRTGQLDGNSYAKLRGWQDSQITVTVNCGSFASTGIYESLGGAGAIVSVEAKGVPYYSILGQLGVLNDAYKLGASAHAPVIGI